MSEPTVTTSHAAEPTVLWWSKSGRDYSRDRILRKAFSSLGWRVVDFQPIISPVADLEARLRRLPTPDLVWIPCFRQRDVEAAQRWARRRNVPVVFDPLISAYDKQVFERQKFAVDSRAAKKLLAWESRLFNNSDLVIADTDCHADFFHRKHDLDRSRLSVIPVGAEEDLFVTQPARETSKPLHVMFYGSFIGLQGPQFIAQAATRLSTVQWTFVGSGPLLNDCRRITHGCRHVKFVPRIPYHELPSWIGQADVLMGVFGTSQKAARVIPNKVYQALACGRPVITQASEAYPSFLRQQSADDSGMFWMPPGDPDAIAATVEHLAAGQQSMSRLATAARATYENFFRAEILCTALDSACCRLLSTRSSTTARAA